MIAALDHVQVAAPRGCEADARGFYGALLGLEEIEKPAPLRARGGAWFRCGAQQLHVGVQEPFVPAAKAHPGLRVASRAELEELGARLAAAGHRVDWEERDARFHTDDPWGNRLELLAPVPLAARALRDDERPWAAAVPLAPRAAGSCASSPPTTTCPRCGSTSATASRSPPWTPGRSSRRAPTGRRSQR